MSKLGDFYMTPYRERSTRKKRNIIIIISLVSVTLIVCGCLGWYYGKKNHETTFEKSDNKTNNQTVVDICADVPDKEKFDCFPDSPVDENKCINRGCCYSPQKSDLPPLNIPYCYYPSNYTGYIIKNVTETSERLLIKLQRVRKSGFINDVSNVDVHVFYIDDVSLRVKITDADSKRYEVLNQLYYETEKTNNPLYSVELDSEKRILTVLRKSTKSIIFKTNLSRLVYSDQFLQLSSDLPSQYVYGIGEHYDGVLRNVNWTRFTLINSDLSPTSNHGLYGSHPFYMALDENSEASGVFLFNSNIMDIILQPTPAITFRPIGGILDFYIMAGPSPNKVIQQYSNIVGKTFMPPFWSLGFHLCRYGYNSLETTKETMERTIAAKIPLDVQWNDIDYMDAYRDFTYDKEKFAGLPEFVENLHARGMHYILMIDPGISNSAKDYAPYDEGVENDIFVKDADDSIFIGKVWPGTTAYPDFSHPKAISYWTRQFQQLYKTIKYDGVWIDMNEPSNFYNGKIDGCPKSSLENPQYVPGGNVLSTKTLCMTAKHYSSSHYNVHNLYAYQEAVATYEAIKSVRKKRPFIISRASFSGQGVFSGHWSGDIFSTWEDMRYSIRSLINFNLYAMPMIGSDICGFNGNVSVDLCARWQSLGAFYPFSRNHNEKDTIEQDPVALGEEVIQATRDALNKRYTLLPYLYTLFYRSHAYGDAVIRPLFLEFPEDKNTYNIDEQFLWGSSLMIIQVLYPDTSSVEAYFPKGRWYDAVTGEETKSVGQKKTLNIPVTYIYLSVRGGIILPAQTPALTTTETRKNPFTLAAALDENHEASGELYWDDGDSLETYENGFYNHITFKVTNNTLVSDIKKQEYKSPMLLTGINIVGYETYPTEVVVNGYTCNSTTPYISNNSSVDEIAFAEDSNFLKNNVFKIGAIKNNLTESGDFCNFFPVLTMLFIQTQPVSLLSPLTVTWK